MEISEQLLAEIVNRVMTSLQLKENQKEKYRDKSGVIAIKTAAVKPEPFDTGKVGDKVYLTDVLSIEESPRLGCGIMEMDHSQFDWTLKYDEIDYVIEGSLEIIIDGNTIRGEKGDILFIPKDSEITFKAPEFARFMYVVYPANWQEQ